MFRNHGRCSYTQLKRCLTENFASEAHFTSNLSSVPEAGECFTNCPPACQQIQFDFLVSESPTVHEYTNFANYSGILDRYSPVTEMRIRSSSFQYSLYAERFETTFWIVTTELGGILGLWLGLDVPFFVDGFLALVKWMWAVSVAVIQKRTSRRAEHEEKIRSEPVVTAD